MGGPAAAGRRVAIVGGGASGLLTAWMLQDQHEVVVFEADARLGGHVRTVPVAHEDGQVVYAEAGFKYFFDRTNPYMRAVFDLLGMTIEWTDAAMTLPHPKVASDLVLPPRNARQLALLLWVGVVLREVCKELLEVRRLDPLVQIRHAAKRKPRRVPRHAHVERLLLPRGLGFGLHPRLQGVDLVAEIVEMCAGCARGLVECVDLADAPEAKLFQSTRRPRHVLAPWR